MLTLLLRFRDLNIPLHQTIARHQKIIENEGETWWGWLMRSDEKCNTDILADFSKRSKNANGYDIFLYHSSTTKLFKANLRQISALPNGQPSATPDLTKTPTYMREARCPAWFLLARIEPTVIDVQNFKYEALPTIQANEHHEYETVGNSIPGPRQLKASAATLWVVRVPDTFVATAAP